MRQRLSSARILTRERGFRAATTGSDLPELPAACYTPSTPPPGPGVFYAHLDPFLTPLDCGSDAARLRSAQGSFIPAVHESRRAAGDRVRPQGRSHRLGRLCRRQAETAFAAAAPLFAPVKLTNFPKDDGIMMSQIKISDDGSTVVFLRGEAPNRENWSPNPTADPNGPEHAIWAARTSAAGGAWRVVDAANPEIAPDGSSILFIKAGQIYRAKLTPVKPASGGQSRRKGLHLRVGSAEQSEIFSGWTQDRVCQHTYRSQLYRRVRRGNALGEIHVAQRRFRHDAHVAGR